MREPSFQSLFYVLVDILVLVDATRSKANSRNLSILVKRINFYGLRLPCIRH
jgi:hypothetical protein